jgi:hypothetical protein
MKKDNSIRDRRLLNSVEKAGKKEFRLGREDLILRMEPTLEWSQTNSGWLLLRIDRRVQYSRTVPHDGLNPVTPTTGDPIAPMVQVDLLGESPQESDNPHF